MGPNSETVSNILWNLRRGSGIKVKDVGGESILRIEWLNLYNHPDVLGSLGELFAHWIVRLGYKPDAVVSIETSGAKYGVSTSLSLGVPYVSLYKGDKLIFDDKSIISRFRKVVIVDDIRRTSHTIDSAVEVIEKCGSSVEACFVVLDFKFAGHPYPRRRRGGAFHSLFEVSSISRTGECEVKDGLAVRYLEQVQAG